MYKFFGDSKYWSIEDRVGVLCTVQRDDFSIPGNTINKFRFMIWCTQSMQVQCSIDKARNCCFRGYDAVFYEVWSLQRKLLCNLSYILTSQCSMQSQYECWRFNRILGFWFRQFLIFTISHNGTFPGILDLLELKPIQRYDVRSKDKRAILFSRQVIMCVI